MIATLALIAVCGMLLIAALAIADHAAELRHQRELEEQRSRARHPTGTVRILERPAFYDWSTERES